MNDKNAQEDLKRIIKEEVKNLIKAPEITKPEEFPTDIQYNKTVDMEKLPSYVPESLKELTLDQAKKLVKWLADRPYKDLIHRQDFINRQIRQAIRKGNSSEENELRILDVVLEKAMVLKNSDLYVKTSEKVEGIPDVESAPKVKA